MNLEIKAIMEINFSIYKSHVLGELVLCCLNMLSELANPIPRDTLISPFPHR